MSFHTLLYNKLIHYVRDKTNTKVGSLLSSSIYRGMPLRTDHEVIENVYDPVLNNTALPIERGIEIKLKYYFLNHEPV